jgi:hypothetical protein
MLTYRRGMRVKFTSRWEKIEPFFPRALKLDNFEAEFFLEMEGEHCTNISFVEYSSLSQC